MTGAEWDTTDQTVFESWAVDYRDHLETYSAPIIEPWRGAGRFSAMAASDYANETNNLPTIEKGRP